MKQTKVQLTRRPMPEANEELQTLTSQAYKALKNNEYNTALMLYESAAKRNLPVSTYLPSLRVLRLRLRNLMGNAEANRPTTKELVEATATLIEEEEDRILAGLETRLSNYEWDKAYRSIKSHLLSDVDNVRTDILLRLCTVLFRIDAFRDAMELLSIVEKRVGDAPSASKEKANQEYYHCCSRWLLQRTEAVEGQKIEDKFLDTYSWETLCDLLVKLRDARVDDNLRKFVHSHLIIGEQPSLEDNNKHFIGSGISRSLDAIRIRDVSERLAELVAQAISSWNEQDQKGVPDNSEVALAILSLPSDRLTVQEWLSLSDIMHWHGMYSNGFEARQKALEFALHRGDSSSASPDDLELAFKATLDVHDQEGAQRLLDRISSKEGNTIRYRELATCLHVFNNQISDAQAEWPYKLHEVEIEFREYVSNKRIAVVGPSVDGIDDNKAIEEHDIVARTNWRGQTFDGQREHFGRRTNISIYNAHTIRLFNEGNLWDRIEDLNFCLVRRANHEITQEKLRKHKICLVPDYSCSFYKSLNGAQALIFHLKLNGARLVNPFKIDLYTSQQHHYNSYRGNVQPCSEENIVSKMKPIILNHDIIGQVGLYDNLVHGMPLAKINGNDIRLVLNRWTSLATKSAAEETKYLDKPKRDFHEHPKVKAKLLKSYCRGAKHFWYSNYATHEFNQRQLPESILRLDGLKVLFIAHNMTLSTGVSRPISHFLNVIPPRMPNTLFESIEFRDGVDVSPFKEEADKYDYIIVNSLGSIAQNPSLVTLIDSISKEKVSIYLHETEWTFKNIQAKHDNNYDAIIKLLSSCRILCVSTNQAKYLNSLGINNTHVVYNTTVLPHDPWYYRFRKNKDSHEKVILMVGTMQSRKGTRLFSDVADLAQLRGRNYKFLWAGSPTKEMIVKSPNVNWLGSVNSQRLQDLIASADLFFLSSIDDPFPLSAIESLLMQKKCVAYYNTGAAEMITSAKGYVGEVFNEYTETAALSAIDTALTTPPDNAGFKGLAEDFSLYRFTERFADAIVKPLQFSSPNPSERLKLISRDDEASRVVTLLCNGPSYANATLDAQIISTSIIVRMNHFYLETEPFADGRVDYYFWAVNEPALHDNIISQIQSDRYRIGRFMCPVPHNELKVSERGWKTLIPESSYFDHWLYSCAKDPGLGRVMMSRPLPTTGLQAMAYFLAQGYRKFAIAGMDFYANNERRYHYDIPDRLKDRMNPIHFKPGYEKGAHSVDADTKFFKELASRYPNMQISLCSQMDVLSDLIQELGISTFGYQ
jgi:glycosyltransferase involved in cell wall biosynthesis